MLFSSTDPRFQNAYLGPLAAVADSLYFVTRATADDVQLMRLPKTGGTPVAVRTIARSPFFLVPFGTGLWSDGAAVSPQSTYNVVFVPLDPTTPLPEAISGIGFADVSAADGVAAYVGFTVGMQSETSPWALARLPQATEQTMALGCTATLDGGGIVRAIDMALTSTHVYALLESASVTCPTSRGTPARRCWRFCRAPFTAPAERQRWRVCRGRHHPWIVQPPMDGGDMHSRTLLPTPPWNEVLRACASGELHPSVFGTRVRLVTDRLEPRVVGIVLESGRRSVDFEPAYICTCGAFALGRENGVTVEDLASATGAGQVRRSRCRRDAAASLRIARCKRCPPPHRLDRAPRGPYASPLRSRDEVEPPAVRASRKDASSSREVLAPGLIRTSFCVTTGDAASSAACVPRASDCGCPWGGLACEASELAPRAPPHGRCSSQDRMIAPALARPE